MPKASTVLKIVAAIVGVGILVATAHLTISKTSGYRDAHAALVLAIAAGVGIGSLSLGHAWSDRRWLLAILLGGAMISGELFGLLQTGDRITAEREARQAPAREKMEAHVKAAKRVDELRAALAALPTTSDWLN